MSVELVHTQPTADTERRCIRIMADALALTRVPRAELRAVYDNLERARDALSRLLDDADGKNA